MDFLKLLVFSGNSATKKKSELFDTNQNKHYLKTVRMFKEVPNFLAIRTTHRNNFYLPFIRRGGGLKTENYFHDTANTTKPK